MSEHTAAAARRSFHRCRRPGHADRGPHRSGAGPVLVDDVRFALKRGEVLGLIGESGAGKSTIGLSTLGYTRAAAASTGGHDVRRQRHPHDHARRAARAARARASPISPRARPPPSTPSMTIMDQVCEAAVRQELMTRGGSRKRGSSSFPSSACPTRTAFGSRYPHQVSGGQLQRAMAAMAMAAKPDLLVFDEPTTALDVTTQVEVLASFRKLIREHGTAALYITHDLAVVAQIADRIMVLRRGKMVELGTARQILQEPSEDYTRRLVARAGRRSHVEQGGATDAPILAIDHVSASYPGKPSVIEDVSLEVRKGDTVAVVGESGSGKVDAGTRRHRTVAARRRARYASRRRACRALARSEQGSASPHPDDLPDAGRGAEPASDAARDDRPAGAVLFPPLQRGGARRGCSNCCARSTCRRIRRRETPANSQAARSRAYHRPRAGGRAGTDHLRRGDFALDQLVGEEILRLLKRCRTSSASPTFSSPTTSAP